MPPAQDSNKRSRKAEPGSWVSTWKAPSSPKRKKRPKRRLLETPNFEAFKKLYDSCGGLIRIVDVAPELPGAAEFARQAARLCTVSAAHTDANYEEAKAAFDAGATHLTNLYECMKKAVQFGVSKEEAILSATLNPAKALDCETEIGSIAPGMRADFVVCDENLNRKAVYIAGERIQR